jgi:hypothetical protein
MSSELESAKAIVANVESFGVDFAGYDETETEPLTFFCDRDDFERTLQKCVNPEEHALRLPGTTLLYHTTLRL